MIFLETLTILSTSRTTHLTWPRFTLYVCLHYVALCPALPNPENGMVMWDTLAPEGVATYTCDPGFTLVGEPTGGSGSGGSGFILSIRICGSDGTWSGMAPTCERKFNIIFLAPYYFCSYLRPNTTSFVDFILPLYIGYTCLFTYASKNQ